MSYHLKHAEHNHSAYQYLQKSAEGNYNDWIVTTAFYSALHYVNHKLFPIDMEFNNRNISVKNINHYTHLLKVNFGDRIDKHAATIALVHTYLQDIGTDYEQLHDFSTTARYHDYKTKESVVKIAHDNILKIKEYCQNSCPMWYIVTLLIGFGLELVSFGLFYLHFMFFLNH